MAHSSEPSVLMVACNAPSTPVILAELEKAGRIVQVATSQEEIREAMAGKVDLVALEAGLPHDAKVEFAKLVASLNPDVPVHSAERSANSHPLNMVSFLKSKIAKWKRSRVGQDGSN